MSSTNKTPNLNLNNWVGSDIPKMADFNEDNSIIDLAISDHTSNSNIHTTASEKTAWSTPFYMQTYTGNGNANRTISISAPFSPKWGIVFKTSYTPHVVDINNEASYHYFGIFSTSGSMNGLSISGKNLTVLQSTIPVHCMEYRTYNEAGSTYLIIAFR